MNDEFACTTNRRCLKRTFGGAWDLRDTTREGDVRAMSPLLEDAGHRFQPPIGPSARAVSAAVLGGRDPLAFNAFPEWEDLLP